MSCKTAISSVRFLFRRSSFLLAGTLVLCLQACTVPSVFTPRISVSGVVLDQFDNPVPNATVRASWLPVTAFPAMPTGEKRNLQANEAGEWSVSMRGIDQMSLRAVPAAGYRYETGRNYSVEVVRDGQQRRTNCVLRLEKVVEK